MLKLCRAGVGLALVAMLWWAVALGAQAASFESCGEAGGRSIAGVADETLAVVAQAALAGGEPVVRYNPRLLPGLSPRARLFLFAEACARHVLGQELEGRRTHDAARRADCWALSALKAAGQISSADDASRLSAELDLSEDDWRRIAGPPRSFRFDQCRDGVFRLPDSAAPGEAQRALDRCTHRCGDRLWQCQQRCRGESCTAHCEAQFERCEGGCP